MSSGKNSNIISFFQGVLGTRFGSLELKIGSLESKHLKFSRKAFGFLQVHTRYLTFSFKKTDIVYMSKLQVVFEALLASYLKFTSKRENSVL